MNKSGGPESLSKALESAKVPQDTAKLALRQLYAIGRSDTALVTALSNAAGIASEIKALRPVPGIDWSPDPVAIASYLTLLYAPADLTPALGVRKLQPGEIMEWKDGNAPVIRRFAARPNEQGPHDLSTVDAVEACRSYLQQAVRRQLVSDVPIGGFLSGGVDSTALAALAVQALDGRLVDGLAGIRLGDHQGRWWWRG